MAQIFKPPSGRGNKKNRNKPVVHSGAKHKGSSASLLELDVSVQDHSGNGLCLTTQPLTVIKDALVGERLSVNLTQQNKNVQFACTKNVLKAHPERQVPFCEYYDSCGGCTMQHASAGLGFDLKHAALQDFFTSRLGIDKQVWMPAILSDIDYSRLDAKTQDADNMQSAVVSAHRGYRRRIRLSIDARNPKAVKVGYRRGNSNEVVDISHCAITSSLINKELEAITHLLKSLPCASKLGHAVITQGYGCDEGEASNSISILQLALFVTRSLHSNSLNALNAFATNHGVVIQVHQKGADIIDVCQDQARLHVLSKTSTHHSVKQHLHANHFIQVNETVNNQMLAQAEEWLAPHKNDTLYDFFCGSGNFSLALAHRVSQVFAFEGVSAMVKAANKNATLNQLDNITFTRTDLSDAKALQKLSIKPDALGILDPSREGAAELSQQLSHGALKRLVYISCNPNTLMRDIKALEPAYEVKKMCALDMFPFTSHLEVMALLVKR